MRCLGMTIKYNIDSRSINNESALTLHHGNYHPQTKFGEGNVFTGVCLFTGEGVLYTLHVSWDSSGGSRISPEAGGGSPTSKLDVKSYYLVNLFPKTAWNWKKFGPPRGCESLAPLDPPLDRSHGSVPPHIRPGTYPPTADIWWS